MEDSTAVALIKQRFDDFETKLDKVVDDHESRLRRLEAWSYAVPVSALLAVGAVVAALVK